MRTLSFEGAGFADQCAMADFEDRLLRFQTEADFKAQEVDEWFVAFDKDRSGTLSRDEVLRLLSEKSGTAESELSVTLVDAIMTDASGSSSGEVTEGGNLLAALKKYKALLGGDRYLKKMFDR